MIYYSPFLLLGILLLTLLSHFPTVEVIQALFLGFLIIVGVLYYVDTREVKRWRYCRYIFFTLALGVSWGGYGLFSQAQRRLPHGLEGHDLLVRGKIISIPQVTPESMQFTLAAQQRWCETCHPHWQAFPKHLALAWYGANQRCHFGQWWQLVVRLKQAHGLSNPGSFDYEKSLLQKNIQATGYVRTGGKSPPNHLLVEGTSAWSWGYWRQTLIQHVDLLLPDAQFSGLLQALLTGWRAKVSSQQWQVFRDTGTAHLIAISGLHIGLISMWLYVIFSRLWRYCAAYWYGGAEIIPGSVLGAGAAIAGAVVYAGLAGFAVSTQRALIMLVVFMSSQLMNRHFLSWRSLALAPLVGVVVKSIAGFFHGVLFIVYGGGVDFLC